MDREREEWKTSIKHQGEKRRDRQAGTPDLTVSDWFWSETSLQFENEQERRRNFWTETLGDKVKSWMYFWRQIPAEKKWDKDDRFQSNVRDRHWEKCLESL